jgi:hypothetical protein
VDEEKYNVQTKLRCLFIDRGHEFDDRVGGEEIRDLAKVGPVSLRGADAPGLDLLKPHSAFADANFRFRAESGHALT